jgi:hypothetical protein
MLNINICYVPRPTWKVGQLRVPIQGVVGMDHVAMNLTYGKLIQ